MENTVARRATSIALMAIMVAGGMTIAFPGATPDAMAAPRSLANLSVSTTMFGGPMVIEIIVQDPNIDETGERQGEPDVTFDGKDLRMIQGSEGYWYAYVANARIVDLFESEANTGNNLLGNRIGTGLDFGTFCEDPDEHILNNQKEFADTADVYTASSAPCEYSQYTTPENLINTGGFNTANNVVRSAPAPSTPAGSGSAGEDDNVGNNDLKNVRLWPFIQAFSDISDDSTIKVVYNKGGSAQEIDIKYEADMDDFASFDVDRSKYPHEAHVHLKIEDNILNIDPTDEDIWTWTATLDDGAPITDVYYQMFDSEGTPASNVTTGGDAAANIDTAALVISADERATAEFGDSSSLVFDLNGALTVTGSGNGAVAAGGALTNLVTLAEDGQNSGVFETTDGDSLSGLRTMNDPEMREVPFTIDYADSARNWFVGYSTAVVNMDAAAVGSDWGSGEELPISVTDQDLNKNSLVTDYVRVGSFGDPLLSIHLGAEDSTGVIPVLSSFTPETSLPVDLRDHASINDAPNSAGVTSVPSGSTVNGDITLPGTMTASILQEGLEADKELYFEWDVSALGPDAKVKFWAETGGDYFTGGVGSGNTFLSEGNKGNVRIDNHPERSSQTSFSNRLNFAIADAVATTAASEITVILRLYDTAGTVTTLEETGTNTGIFDGTIEYVLLNQINTVRNADDTADIANPATAALETGLVEDTVIILDGDYLDEDGIRMDYDDTDEQGQETVVSVKTDAPTHSGSITLDQDSYKKADTVQITLSDSDLNLNTELRDIYTVLSSGQNRDTIARSSASEYVDRAEDGLMLEGTFNDARWISCDNDGQAGFGSLISSIRETAPTSGVFVADFQVPEEYCYPDLNEAGTAIADVLGPETTLGKDLEVTYHDYFDSAGERNEVGDVAGITSFTGSISLDRSVYPVPFDNGNRDGASNAVFRFHETLKASDSSDEPRYVPNGAAATGATAERDDVNGDVVIHVQINDKDLDTSGSGTDRIEDASTVLKVEISRDGNSVPPASATDTVLATKEIVETSPTSGIFEIDLGIAWNDGPWQGCPRGDDAFPSEDDTATATVDERRCLLQGDIITVTYTDASDATGNENTVTDSATFDLRNGVLQSDKSVYIIGSDMILTLIDPDLDLDNDGKQSYSLDLIEWDSDAATVTMGRGGGSHASFDPEPATLQETGDSTGIFQSIVEIPESLQGEELDRGEEIALEYTDWGPSGADFVGEESQDISLTVYTSNFGATIELDQKVYSWTDKVFITIVAPDHNFDSSLIDEIGRDTTDPLQIATQEGKIDNYRLAETGPDTGIFTGEVILTGFDYEVNDDITVTPRGPTGDGPTDGLLPATDDDGVTVSYEYSEDETVVGSSLIRWNIGEAEWLAASYPASGTGVIRVIDPDMNINPEAVDNFQITVISDSVASGISLTVTETSQAAGIFEGTVFFTTTDAPTGSRLRVAEGDTITAEYDDTTLPDPYSRNDELTISATALIGTIVPPLERVPVSNLRVVDNFGATLDTVQVDQQVQVTADLTNGQTRDQAFAYLVQIQDEDNVTVHLAWISGSVAEGQSFSPSVSWTPAASGTYTATTFAWESVSNPEALSPPVSLEITVG